MANQEMIRIRLKAYDHKSLSATAYLRIYPVAHILPAIALWQWT